MARKRPADLYRSMHSGLTARAIKVPAFRPPRAVIDVRRVTAIEGDQLQGPDRWQGSGVIPYRHEFRGNSGPMMTRDAGRSRNNMTMVGGAYRINDEGMIEDTMSHRKHHHWMHRYVNNPEPTLELMVKVGLALAVVTILADLTLSMLPARWSSRTKTIGLDAVLVLGGLFVYKKSPTWGVALAGFGIGDAANATYVGLGIDAKVRAMFHRTPTATATTVTVASLGAPDASGNVLVTYSDNTTATVPAASAPALNSVKGSHGLMYRLGAGQRQGAAQYGRPRVAAGF